MKALNKKACRPPCVAVLGGGGFLGSWTCDRLLGEGFRVRVLERSGFKPWRLFRPDEPVEWCTGDAGSPDDLKATLVDVDSVVHLASASLPGADPREQDLELARDGSALSSLLEVVTALKIPRLVFISSGGCVYGHPLRLPIDEDHPTRPINGYGLGKLAAEELLLAASRDQGLRVQILRVANAYGARQRQDHRQGVVSNFFHRMRQGLPLIVYGDGSAQRDFIHAADVAKAIACALHHSGPSQIFNIGSGQATRIDDLIGQIERLFARSAQIHFRPARPGDVQSNALNCRRAMIELGWWPQIELKAGLAMTY